MPPALVAGLKARRLRSEIDLEKLRREESEGLIANLIGQRARITSLIADAMDLADVRTAVACERALLENLIAAARILGEIGGTVTNVQNNLLVAPDYLRLRAMLLEALKPYREARVAVARALATIESKQIAPSTGANGIAESGSARTEREPRFAPPATALLEFGPATDDITSALPTGTEAAGPLLLDVVEADVTPDATTSVVTLVR